MVCVWWLTANCCRFGSGAVVGVCLLVISGLLLMCFFVGGWCSVVGGWLCLVVSSW